MVIYRNDVLMPLDRNPVETGLLAWAVYTGARRTWVLLFGGHIDPATALPSWWVDLIWHLLLLFGGVLALAGAYWPDAIDGVKIVRWAMWPLGAGCLLYACGLVLGATYGPAVPIALFGATFMARAAQITRDLRTSSVIRRPT